MDVATTEAAGFCYLFHFDLLFSSLLSELLFCVNNQCDSVSRGELFEVRSICSTDTTTTQFVLQASRSWEEIGVRNE